MWDLDTLYCILYTLYSVVLSTCGIKPRTILFVYVASFVASGVASAAAAAASLPPRGANPSEHPLGAAALVAGLCGGAAIASVYMIFLPNSVGQGAPSVKYKV